MKGEGNQQDYGMRIYDPRIGKFLSVDPLAKCYPWNSTYAFAENDVIRSIDLDGGEKKHYMLAWDQSQRVVHLQYLGQEDFEETKTDWSFSRDGLVPTHTKVKNPRQEYVVHGVVKVPYGLQGGADTYHETSWTFSSESKMRAAEASRGISTDGSNYSDKWFYTGSDDRWSFSRSQMLFNGIEAESEVGTAKGLWYGKQVIRAKELSPQTGKDFIVIIPR